MGPKHMPDAKAGSAASPSYLAAAAAIWAAILFSLIGPKPKPTFSAAAERPPASACR